MKYWFGYKRDEKDDFILSEPYSSFDEAREQSKLLRSNGCYITNPFPAETRVRAEQKLKLPHLRH